MKAFFEPRPFRDEAWNRRTYCLCRQSGHCPTLREDIPEVAMQVSKWGNSLAVRLPKKLVEAMGLKPGDDIDLVALGSQELGLSKRDTRAEFLDKIAAFDWPLPEGYEFDREEANKR